MGLNEVFHSESKQAAATIVYTVVHVDTHAYVDTFLDKSEAENYIILNEPHFGMWKIISKVVR